MTPRYRRLPRLLMAKPQRHAIWFDHRHGTREDHGIAW